MIDRMKTVPELGGVETGGAEFIGLRDLDAVDELHGDDALARQLVVDGRHVDLGEARHAVGEAAGVVGLVAIVEFLEDAAGELGDDRLEPDLARERQPLFGDAGQLLDHTEVGLGLGHDPRSLDLDRDERPVVEAGLVDLRRRRRRERDRVEGLEELPPAASRAPW